MFILNTRPQGQAQNLNNLIKKSGGNFFNLPCIEIIPIQFEYPSLNNVDYLIFQSANAVQFFFQSNNQKKLDLTIIAMGSSTKNSLEKKGFRNVVVPTHYNSKGILNLSILKNSRDKKILIISGMNPKLILSKELKNRGAEVQLVYCYRRICPIYNVDWLLSKLLKKEIDCIVSTSLESLKNLLAIFKVHRHWLFSKTLCVISDNMRAFAKAEGFIKIIQSKNATDEAVVQKLFKY